MRRNDFGDSSFLLDHIRRKFGQHELDKSLEGQPSTIQLDIVFTVGVNEYMGKRAVQLVMQHFR